MHQVFHINPDDYLETEKGRVYTPERSKAAWEKTYADLEAILKRIGKQGQFYIVCGGQGSGKSTWIQKFSVSVKSPSVFLDAALPAKVHRARALSIAAKYLVPAIGVFVDAPLEVAFKRNLQRTMDHQVPESSIRRVFEMIEPPSEEEGFIKIIRVDTR